MRCYSVSRNTRSGSWRWWSDASTSGSSPTGTTRTPCPDSSRRPRSSPVRNSSQCWQFSRYFLDNQTIYPRTPNFVWLSWISVSKNNLKFMYFIHWPTAKVGVFFLNKGGTEIHLSEVPANTGCVSRHPDGHLIINVANISWSSRSLLIMEIFLHIILSHCNTWSIWWVFFGSLLNLIILEY